MTEFKSVNDILDFAIKEEEAAQKFYEDLARRSDNAAMRSVFESFAREEKGHKA
jgi:rubrerythrin